MAVVTGVITPPVAGRIDAALGEPNRTWLWSMVPIGLLAAVALLVTWPALVVVSVACMVYLGRPKMVADLLRRRGRLLLQVLVCAAVLVTLPGFVSAVADIA